MASGVGLLCYLAQVPIALNYLGSEAFGFWMTIVSLINLMLVMDFGIGNSLQNKVAESLARGDKAYTSTIARSGFLVSLGIGLALALLAIPLLWTLNWAEIFRLTDPELRANVRWALAIMISVIALSLPMGVIPKILLGSQRGWLFGISNASISILTLACVAFARWMEVGFLMFLTLALIPSVVSRLALLPITLNIRQKAPWLARRSDVKNLTKLGGKFMIVQLGALVLFTAPAIIISSILGVAALTPYNLCQRIFSIPSQAQFLVLNPLMASFSEAKARMDFAWIRKGFLIALSLAVVGVGSFCLVMVIAGPPIFTFWTGSPDDVPPTELIFWFAIWTFVICLSSPISTLLNGISRMNALTVYSTITSTVALVLMIYFTRTAGATGTVMALAISYSCIGLPATSIDAFLALRSLSPLRPPASEPESTQNPGR